MLVPAPDVARPWRSQGTAEPCHVRAVETPSLLPSRPITGPIPQPPCPARPPGCWRSCSPPRMSAASASRRWRPRGSARIAAQGAARPGRGGLRVEAGGHVTCPGHLPASGAGEASAMIRRRREKVFGPGRAVPLDRNAKARILAYAQRLGRPTPPAGPTQGPDHPRLPGGAGGAAMGLPQLPLRLLLPELRGDRRQGGVRPQHRRRGAEGPGVGRRADLAEPDHPDPRPRARSVRPLGEPLAGDPHQSMPTCSAIRSSVPRAFQLPSPKIRSEHRIKRLLILLWHRQATRTAHWSAPCGSSAAPSKEDCSLNKSGGMVPAT